MNNCTTPSQSCYVLEQGPILDVYTEVLLASAFSGNIYVIFSQ